MVKESLFEAIYKQVSCHIIGSDHRAGTTAILVPSCYLIGADFASVGAALGGCLKTYGKG